MKLLSQVIQKFSIGVQIGKEKFRKLEGKDFAPIAMTLMGGYILVSIRDLTKDVKSLRSDLDKDMKFLRSDVNHLKDELSFIKGFLVVYSGPLAYSQTSAIPAPSTFSAHATFPESLAPIAKAQDP